MVNAVTFEIEGEKKSMVLQTKKFSTGKEGFGSYGKLELHEGKDRYQVSLNVVKIVK